jgi:dienelactone hydrolase
MQRTYDPFERGEHPVGVRSETWRDAARDRALDVEIWYPAAAGFAGCDIDPATQDAFPIIWTTAQRGDAAPGTIRQSAVRDATPAKLPGLLVLFSHGYAGHRREATFLSTHLASHGYVVVSADHIGSTSWDVDAALEEDHPEDRQDARHTMGINRKGDVPFLVAEATRRGYASAGAIGVTGISLGGWTTLIAPAVEPRVAAIAPMCPAGGRSPVSPGKNALSELLELGGSDQVYCLHMVADRDAWLPLYGQLEIFARLPGPAQMVILRDADHNHFVDDIPTSHAWYREITLALAEAYPDGDTHWNSIAQSIAPIEELVDAEVAYALWRGLTVAHFDARLRGRAEAVELLEHRVRAEAQRLGASVLTIEGEQRANRSNR